MSRDQGWNSRTVADGETVRVFIVSEHGPERQALHELLEDEGLDVLGSTSSVSEALARIRELLPDVVLLDTRIQDDVWISVCRSIWGQNPSVRCLSLGSLQNESELRGAVLAGVKGHAVRMVRGGDLLRRIRAVAAGEDLVDAESRAAVQREFAPGPRASALDSMERHILFQCANGLSNGEIALEMGLDETGVQRALRGALATLGYVAGRSRGAGRAGPRGTASVRRPAWSAQEE